MDCNNLKKQFDALVTDRRTLDQVFELIEKFVVPFRGRFFEEDAGENSIEWRKRDKFDDTAVMAAQTLASSIQSALTSPSTKWFSFLFRQDELNKNEEAKKWLEECEVKCFQALQDSNFNSEASEYYLDIVSMGTGVILEEWNTKEEEFEFTTIPLDEAYFHIDHKNRMISLFRKLNWTPIQIVEKFGMENVPQSIKDKALNADQKNTKIKVIFAIYKRKNKNGVNTSKVLTPENRPFGYKYFTYDSCDELGKEGGYYEMPAFSSRWRKVSGSKMGYSPAMVVLSDILTLNEVTEMTLEALGKVIDPTTLTTERGLLSDLDLSRGGLTVVRDINDVKAYESKARFDVGEIKIDRIQESINRAFFVDQLQLKQSPAMTATEVQVRYELMQRLLGPTYGRFKEDWLDPSIQRTFWTQYREGKLPEMPDSVKELQGEFDIEYVGPMAKAQKAEVMQSIERWIASLASISEAFPEVMDIPDVDAIAKGLADMSGVPLKYINKEDNIKETREARKEQQKITAGIENAQGAAKAAKDFGAEK